PLPNPLLVLEKADETLVSVVAGPFEVAKPVAFLIENPSGDAFTLADEVHPRVGEPHLGGEPPFDVAQLLPRGHPLELPSGLVLRDAQLLLDAQPLLLRGRFGVGAGPVAVELLQRDDRVAEPFLRTLAFVAGGLGQLLLCA